MELHKKLNPILHFRSIQKIQKPDRKDGDALTLANKDEDFKLRHKFQTLITETREAVDTSEHS
ncbi:MAG: hypothetical protein J0I32_23520 [Sphingobacteriales bacterium]|nr:hypothetical protein [Sphingobacteriales bacterium]OJW02010.1 MAG: hypothetical protein BGO52_00575 [Sphingobacteriales bacterium 44-61]